MNRRTILFAAVSSAVAASTADAKDSTIDLLLPGEKVSSSLAATGERKVIGFAGVEGATLDVGVDGSAAPRLSVLAPDGAVTTPAPSAKPSPHHARIKGLALTTTGVWRIVVEAAPHAGGAFTLSTSAKVPTRFGWTGTLDASSPSTVHAVPAAPGGRMSVVVAMQDAASPPPVVELIAPTGDVVAGRTGAGGRAVAGPAKLSELGVYAVRVSGGSGAFTATAVVKPARRRSPKLRQVEAAPDVFTFAPTTTPNQLVLALSLQGVGFSDGQKASVVDGTRTLATGAVHRSGELDATAVVDLTDVAPGTYSLVVASPGGNSAVAAAPLVVVNRAPQVSLVDPREAPNLAPFPLSVRGVGFDADASVFVRRSSDGLSVPTVVSSRSGHVGITVNASPPPYATGPCDVEVRESDGSRSVAQGALDLLGFRAAPAAVRTYVGVDAPDFIVCGAAVDEAHGRTLLAVRERSSRAAFVLFDSATSAVVDSLEIDAQDVGAAAIDQAAVACDGVGGTFAICVLSQQHPVVADLRVVSSSDLHQTLAETALGAGAPTGMTNVAVAAERDHGGYLAVWQQLDAVYGARVLAQPVAVDGGIDPSTRPTIGWDPYGNLGFPDAAYQGAGRFIVAWAGVTDDYRGYAVRATVTDSVGAQVAGFGPYVVAASNTWAAVQWPRLAVNPADGSALVAFSYSDGIVLRPACQTLAAGTAAPGAFYAILDGELPFPGGRANGLAFSPARSEFVAAVWTYDGHVVLRRVNRDGSVRAAPVLESYEGDYGVIYAGSTAASLGFARSFDGDADGVDDPSSTTRQAVVGPIR